MSSVTTRTRPQHCRWCGRELAENGTGRPRKYCSPSCKQRAYEQRKNLTGTGIPADAVIYSASSANLLLDELFELRCAAEDIQTAVSEGEDAASISELATELVDIARRIEKLRGQTE